MQGAKDLSALQINEATAARGPGASTAQPLARPLDSADMESSRQLSGDVAPVGAAVMPPARVTTADSPEQFADRQRFLNAREVDQAQVEAANAMHFAEATVPSQQMQRHGDMARSASMGYQQSDMTGAFADAQEQARSFAGDYTWNLLNEQGRGVVDSAILRLGQGGAA